jgi:hypothetical protein
VVATYPPEEAAGICGVGPGSIREAARLLGTGHRLVSTVLQGVYHSHQATAAAVQVNNIIGRRPEAGLLLLRDLRQLFLMAQEANIHWIALGQVAQAVRDHELLDEVSALHKQTLTQIKWLKTRIKEVVPDQGASVPSWKAPAAEDVITGPAGAPAAAGMSEKLAATWRPPPGTPIHPAVLAAPDS